MNNQYVYIVAEDLDYDYNPFSATYATFSYVEALKHLKICKEHEKGKSSKWAIWRYEMDTFCEPISRGPIITDIVYPREKE